MKSSELTRYMSFNKANSRVSNYSIFRYQRENRHSGTLQTGFHHMKFIPT